MTSGSVTAAGGNQSFTPPFSTNAPSSGSVSLSGPTPTADANTTAMLGSVIYRSGPANGEGFTLNQTVTNGTYQVYLWMVENYMSNVRDMDIKVEGATTATAVRGPDHLLWQNSAPTRRPSPTAR
ncbi:MAG TPA: hypothetical protein VJL81_13345 [Solirubrobacterales bacterium]|nr:hypothetical protein [Solirubrobacterales bacterium]